MGIGQGVRRMCGVLAGRTKGHVDGPDVISLIAVVGVVAVCGG